MSATRVRSSPLPSWPADPTARTRAGASRAGDAAAVLAPALLALALVLVGLGKRSLWLDEGATVAIASQHGAALWHAIAHDGGNMLLYYLLEHVLIGWFGAGPVAIRLPSAIADGGTAGLVAMLALRLYGDLGRGRVVAVAAGVLTAVSLPLVFWGQDARGYALMVALACASWLAFVAVLDGGRGAARLAYVLTTIAALYVGYDAALVVAAQLAVLVGRRLQARVVFACLVCVAVACVPLAVLALGRGSGQLFWVPGLGGPVLGQAGTTLLSAGLSPNFHYTATTTLTAVLGGVIVLAGCWRALSRPRMGGGATRVAALWLLVPLALGLLAALAGEPIELARAAVLLIPAVALLSAWLLLSELDRGWVRWAGPLVLAALIALRALQLAPSYGVSPEDWKAAATYVSGHTSALGACVAFYPQDGRMPFDVYARGGAAAARLTPVLPAAPWSRVEPFVERYAAPGRAALASIERRCPVLWLVASHQGQAHATAASAANLRRYRTLLATLGRAYARHSPRRFGYAAAVAVTRFGP